MSKSIPNRRVAIVKATRQPVRIWRALRGVAAGWVVIQHTDGVKETIHRDRLLVVTGDPPTAEEINQCISLDLTLRQLRCAMAGR